MYTGDAKYDVIIIGCGIAGATLGYLLKKDGFKVLVLDHRKYKGKHKLCSGILTNRSFELLKSIYDVKTLENYAIIGRFDEIVIKSVFTAKLKGLDIKVANRKRLDIFLANHYVHANGDLIEECGPLEYDFENKSIQCGMFTYTYDVLVAADGVVSSLRKLLTGKFQSRYVSMQCTAKPDAAKMIFEFKKNLVGYYWFISTTTKTLIGCTDFKKYRNTIPEFKKHITKYNTIDSEIISGIRPTGEEIMLKSRNFKDVYFIGDAAGLTSPLTGEGIYHALNSAYLLYKALSEKTDYEKLMKPTLTEIRKELAYKKRIYGFYHRLVYIFIMSRKGLFSKLYQKKLKANLHFD